MASYGSFPGVKVRTESGGIQSVEIGAEEKLVFFGEANYAVDNGSVIVEGDDATLDVNANESEQINAPRMADLKFGEGSELAEAMKNSLGNGANIDFLYGVPVQRKVVEAEPQTSASGTLDNVEIVENTGDPVDTAVDGAVSTDDTREFGIQVDVYDTAGGTTVTSDVPVELRYDGAPGSPNPPTDDNTGTVDEVWINPLTGEYAADEAPGTDEELRFSYTYNDYASAFQSSSVQNIVNEDETGIFFALTDSNSVSSDLNTVVGNLRNNYKLVNALSFAEPNFNSTESPPDARFDADNYSKGSVSAAYYYKFAPGREENVDKTVGGGIGGLFAGNPINDPIYNEVISGYDALEQQLSKSDADNLRDKDVIPIRSGGNVRVKGNRATNYSVADTVAADFWTRRITDRVILIGKQIGDAIIGRINDEDTRALAERRIEQEMRSLESQRLIRPNTGTETNWNVTAYEDSTNSDEVNIDITFTPYGIVKQVDETITVDTN